MARHYGTVDYPAGLRPGDHLCWIYDDHDSWRSAATAFLLEGATRGERLLYLVGDTDPDGLVRQVSGRPGRDDLIAAGQFLVMPVDGPAAASDADARLEEFRRLIVHAVRDGFHGLRLAADTSSLFRVTPDPSDFMAFEIAFDAMIASVPAAAMCGFDRAVVGDAVARQVSFTHPLCHRPGLDTGVHLYADGHGGWHLVGGVDLTHAGQLATALATLPRTGDVHLRLDGLRFCDGAATEVLIAAAAGLHPEARLVLHDPPPLLRRVLDVAWPGDNPGLVLVTTR